MAAKNMFLKCHSRIKDGKEHRYYSIAEKMACAGGRRVDRHVFYLGEINDSQREAWLRCIEVFDVQAQDQTKLALFASDQPVPAHATACGVQVRLTEFRLCRPRQWGACWVFLLLWEQLKLGEFWSQRLPASREHTSWYHILVVLCAYRWIDPGSEWRLHREWYSRSAMGDLLDEDFGLAAKDNFYRCLDKLVEHKAALFGFLQERWKDLFGVTFDVLLYDLTSTYFESDPPFPENDKRQFGYSRDKRPDCVQVVIALVVTPEGFPLAYEVLSGNTSDKTTLKSFLEKIQNQYGKARRIWLMDRGIPTKDTAGSIVPEAVLAGGPFERTGQALGARGRVLRAGQQPGPGEQGTGDSAAQIEGVMGAAQGIERTAAQLRSLVDEAWSGQTAGGPGLVTGETNPSKRPQDEEGAPATDRGFCVCSAEHYSDVLSDFHFLSSLRRRLRWDL